MENIEQHRTKEMRQVMIQEIKTVVTSVYSSQICLLSWKEGSIPKGGGALIFSYIRRLGSFFGVQNF